MFRAHANGVSQVRKRELVHVCVGKLFDTRNSFNWSEQIYYSLQSNFWAYNTYMYICIIYMFVYKKKKKCFYLTSYAPDLWYSSVYAVETGEESESVARTRTHKHWKRFYLSENWIPPFSRSNDHHRHRRDLYSSRSSFAIITIVIIIMSSGHPISASRASLYLLLQKI